MKNTWKHILAAACIGAAVLVPAFGSSAKEEPLIGMPNPIVEYQTMPELEKVVGFRPLVLPKGTFLGGKYKVEAISSISGQLADVRYKLKGKSTLTIRSQRFDVPSSQDISGVYTGNWKRETIGQTGVDIAKLPKDSYAARWVVGNYSFAVVGEHMKEKDFRRLLTEVLVDRTEDFYGQDEQVARDVKF